MTPLALPAGVRDLAGRYDGFIVDLWGVLHDGVTAFPDALDALARLRRRGKRIVVLSNAPRRAQAVAERNAELGIGPQHVDGLLSSGEAAWQRLARRDDPWYRRLGRRCFHLGPERDLGMLEGLEYSFLRGPEAADFVLLTGADGPEDTVERYAALLEAIRARGLPMICANPDLEVIRGGRREICAGAIAARYEALGGVVRYHGKPHREIYELCLARFDLGERSRILAIGDSLRTDIAGAHGAGLDSLFVTGGIHAEELGVDPAVLPPARRLDQLLAGAGLRPVAVVPQLRW